MAQSALARAQVEELYAGKDVAEQLVSTPATEHPSGQAERNLQSLMKARRVDFVVRIMVQGEWTPERHEELAAQWWPKRDGKHQREKMKEIASIASSYAAPMFDRKAVGERIVQRMEIIQTRALDDGRPMVAIRAAELQLKVTGAGQPEYPEGYGPRVETTTVQVINVQGQEVARTNAMSALFRGRPAKQVDAPAEPSKAEDQKSILGNGQDDPK